jgi:hypothetical protein
MVATVQKETSEAEQRKANTLKSVLMKIIQCQSFVSGNYLKSLPSTYCIAF